MQDMRDHEFDALFKEAAENLEVPYNPKGWKRMQIRLNNAGGGRMGLLRKGLWGLGALLLLGVGWWIAGIQQTAPIALEAAHQVALKEALPPLPKVTSREGISSLTEDRQTVDQQAKQDVEAENTEVLQKVSQSEVKRKVKSAYINDDVGNLDEIKADIFTIQKVEGTHLMEAHGLREEAWLSHGHSPEKVDIHDIVQPGMMLLGQAPQEVIKTRKRYAANRWGLSLGISPDLSGVGIRGIDRVSTNVAIQLEFFALPDLSISSGVLFSNKVYGASPEDYHPKYPYKNIPTAINGQCKVLDIPLNIRWYALSGEKSRFFISGGISSYMMLSEDYEYVYDNKGKSYSRDYGYENENQHLFKVANFSLGYERALGKQWAVQVEPFVKLPLAGVGEGEIKLSTTGAFFSVHYRWGEAR